MHDCGCVLPHAWEVIRTEGLIQLGVAPQLEMSESPQTCNRYWTETVLSQVPGINTDRNRGGVGSLGLPRLTVIHTYIHTLIAVAAMQGAVQHISSSLGFSILPKDTSTWGTDRGTETSVLPITRRWLYPWAIVAQDWPRFIKCFSLQILQRVIHGNKKALSHRYFKLFRQRSLSDNASFPM